MASPIRTDAIDTDAVLASLEGLAKLYRALDRLSARQRRLIETADHGSLLRLLQAKQVIVDRLQACQPEVEAAVSAWRDRPEAVPEPDRDRIRALLAEIDGHLNDVMAADTEDAQRLACRRSQAAAQVNQNRRTAQAARAYRRATGSPPAAPRRLNVEDG